MPTETTCYLQVNDKRIPHPSPDAIRQVFEAANREEENFISLHRNSNAFLQVAFGPDMPFLLVAEGEPIGKRFTAFSHTLAASEMIDIFQRYLQQDPTWKQRIHWQVDTIEDVKKSAERRGKKAALLTLCVATAVTLLLLGVSLARGSMNLHQAGQAFASFVVVVFYFAWLSYFFITRRPLLAAWLGKKWKIQIADGTSTYERGWTVVGKTSLFVRALVVAMDIGLCILATVGVLAVFFVPMIYFLRG